MPKYFVGRLVVILLSALVFAIAIAELRSGKARSRGYTFDRDDQPVGYWSTVLVALVGPVAIIYLMLTR